MSDNKLTYCPHGNDWEDCEECSNAPLTPRPVGDGGAGCPANCPKCGAKMRGRTSMPPKYGDDIRFECLSVELFTGELRQSDTCLIAELRADRDRLAKEVELLYAGCESDPKIRGGEPCIKGTRFPLCQLIAEIPDTPPFNDFCKNFDIEPTQTREALERLAWALDWNRKRTALESKASDET